MGVGMSKLDKFFKNSDEIKLYESGQQALENKITLKEKPKSISRRRSWKSYLAIGASLVVMDFANPKEANLSPENSSTDNLNLKNKIELADLTVSRATINQNTATFQEAAADSVKRTNIGRISDFIKNKTKKELTFSITDDLVLMLGDKALVGKKGVDYEKALIPII
jgi:hypothetical protein